jgi:hypothetical protein
MKARVAAVEQQIKVKSAEAADAVDLAAELASELRQTQKELSAAQASRQKYKTAAAAAKQHSKALETALEQYKKPQQQLEDLHQRLAAQQQLLQHERANHEMTQQREAQTAAALSEGHERLAAALSTLAVTQQDLQHMHAEAELLEAQVLAADQALAHMTKTAATKDAQLQKHLIAADAQQQKLREQLSLALSAAAGHQWMCGRLAAHNHSLQQQLEQSTLQQQETALAAADTISCLQQDVEDLQAQGPQQQHHYQHLLQQQQQQKKNKGEQQEGQQEQQQQVQVSASVAALDLPQLEQAFCKLPAKAACAQQGPCSPAYSDSLGDLTPASDADKAMLATSAVHSGTNSSPLMGNSLAHIHTLLLAAAAAPVTAHVLAAAATTTTTERTASDVPMHQEDSCALLLLQEADPLQCNPEAAVDLLLCGGASEVLQQRSSEQWGSGLCTSCSEEDIGSSSRHSSRHSSRPSSRHSSRPSSKPSSRRSSITSWYSCSSRWTSRGGEGEQLPVAAPGPAAQAPVPQGDAPELD